MTRIEGLLVAGVILVTATGCSQLTRIEDKVDQVSKTSHGLQVQQKEMAGQIEEVRKALDAEGITSDEKRAEMLSRFKSMERSLQQVEARLDEQDEVLRRIQARLELLAQSGARAVPAEAESNTDSAATRAAVPSSGASEQSTGAGSAGTVQEGAATGSLIQSGSPGAEVYDAAFRDFTRGSYTLARDGFREFLSRYPRTDLADNAKYWIGESYYAQGNYRKAVEEFEGVLRTYPDSDILASALLKASNCHLELGETDRAVEGYRRLVKDWSDSDESFIARQKLAEIGSAP